MAMKLYVWTDVLWDYGAGLAVALAPDVETARALVRKHRGCAPPDANGYDSSNWNDFNQEPQVLPVNKPWAITKYGSA